jgi:hypothetical protein
MMDETNAALAAYETKRVDFRFRSKTMRLSLSHALFSSADVDAGTRFLLRVLSRLWDEDLAAAPEALPAAALPRTILDAGCGVGVIGIAAAGALVAEGKRDLRVRAQDRDELARAFTAANAAANGIGPEVLTAYAEPLLSGPPRARWDLILSNVPAKAGSPVLADFFFRSTRLLSVGGRALVVVVNPLAEAARSWIAKAGAAVDCEESSAEHTVFAYGRPTGTDAAPIEPDPAIDHLAAAEAEPFSFPGPAYLRTAGDFELEDTAYRIEALHGVADFDEPSRAVVLAAKLLGKIGAAAAGSRADGRGPAVLVHECDQGHFPAWLVSRAAAASSAPPRLVLVGRNVLALAAARNNTLFAAGGATAGSPAGPATVSVRAAVDLGICAAGLLAEFGLFDLVVSFPEAVPRVDRAAASWAAVSGLLAPGGLFLVAQTSTEAERFDRSKPRGFSRAGELKRDGFRAQAYRKSAD